MQSYSQHQQDLWILEKLNQKRNGYFLDIGAGDGIFLSNTYLMEKDFGWKGIACEPNREFFGALETNRDCHVDPRAVYKRDGSIEFIEEGKIIGGIKETCTQFHQQWIMNENHKQSISTVSVECVTPTNLLKHYIAPNYIDFLSLDTEGSEFEILNVFPWDEYVVGLIIYEHNWEQEKIKKINNLLVSKGYKFLRNHECDHYYEHVKMRKFN